MQLSLHSLKPVTLYCKTRNFKTILFLEFQKFVKIKTSEKNSFVDKNNSRSCNHDPIGDN